MSVILSKRLQLTHSQTPAKKLGKNQNHLIICFVFNIIQIMSVIELIGQVFIVLFMFSESFA